jgi:hypothetical protein
MLPDFSSYVSIPPLCQFIQALYGVLRHDDVVSLTVGERLSFTPNVYREPPLFQPVNRAGFAGGSNF